MSAYRAYVYVEADRSKLQMSSKKTNYKGPRTTVYFLS